MQATAGEAAIGLLAEYGVETVFGIPGVHTLEMYRGLAAENIRHVQARNEQGAGFMADGYARASGRPGVAVVISGPGVTNALTAIGQAWADSVPVLLLSAETATHTHGKGWGALHEIPDQPAVTSPLTAFSARAGSPDEVPRLIHRAFSVFASERPRPVHISIPIDVQAQAVESEWSPEELPSPPSPDDDEINRAVQLLVAAKRPLVMIGGGATGAATPIRELVATLGASVIASAAGKGVVPDDSPVSLSAGTIRLEVRDHLEKADVVMAIGTELAETDSFVERLPLPDNLIRVDIDPSKIGDYYPAAVGIVADAALAIEAMNERLVDVSPAANRSDLEADVATAREEISANLDLSQQRHVRLLRHLREIVAEDAVVMGDICQVVYTGAFAYDARLPRTWHYPAGFCTLGCGLPDAIGAKLALPDRDVICLVGDGGVMFTIQELMTASELGLPIPVIVWDNDGYKQIRDDMRASGIPPIGVDGLSPDFIAMAQAMGAYGVRASSKDELTGAVLGAFGSDRPTVITVREGEGWLS